MDRGMVERIAAAALRHRYADPAAAGVELWELPGAVVYAKVVVADDVVSFGTVNLDAWALYRNVGNAPTPPGRPLRQADVLPLVQAAGRDA